MNKKMEKVLIGTGKDGFTISNDNYVVKSKWGNTLIILDKITDTELVTISKKNNEKFHTKKILDIYGFVLTDFTVLNNHNDFVNFFRNIETDISITAKGKFFSNGEIVPKQYIQHRHKVIINF